ncbi:hypothetical protein CAOG_01033 [Capsaspora owczarzaki ATCC 30864]|nr:hypothetical protein CAOG_01033 [Capsaspora owczarzaki ATCC 30864]|eukprot:XP_004365904.1 hypothetical protein CAOG_01033 [Capsaspora owczarzaki ATCC 30864]
MSVAIDDRFPVETLVARNGEVFQVAIAAVAARPTLRDVITTLHLVLSAPDTTSVAYAEQVRDLPTDFPLLYNDSVFLESRVWMVFRAEDTARQRLLGSIAVHVPPATASTARAHSAETVVAQPAAHLPEDGASPSLHAFFLDDSIRAAGLGTQLLARALNYADAHSDQLYLYTLPTMMPAALSLYQRNGFVMHKQIDTDWFRTWRMVRTRPKPATNPADLNE